MDNCQRKPVNADEELKSKYLILQHDWRCQQKTIGRLEIQMMKLRSQLKQQAQFCSKTGSVFGHNLWKASQIPEITSMMLQEDKILELSQIMVNVLTSFNDIYQTKTPISDTDETRFVISIIGLVANLTTLDRGRRFFSQTESGKNVIKLIMNLVQRVPSPSGNQLKKVSYAALYNVSIYLIGSPSQIINAELVALVNDDINDVDNIAPDIRMFALKLIQGLIRNICTKTTYNIVKDNLEQSQLDKLATEVDEEVVTIARSILDDFRNAKEQFEAKITMK